MSKRIPGPRHSVAPVLAAFAVAVLFTRGCPSAPHFRSQRVADHELSEPSAPQVCSPEGKPAADPADVPAPGSRPTDIQPTDIRPTVLCPTPGHSLDIGDVLRSPTP